MEDQQRIFAQHPPGWSVKEQVTLLEPSGRANVIASSEELSGEPDSAAYVQAQGEILKAEYPGFEELSLEPIQLLGGQRGWLRRFRWQPNDGLPVTQLQMYFVQGSRGFTATATASSQDFAGFEQVLRDVLESLSFKRAVAAPDSGAADELARQKDDPGETDNAKH